LMKPFAFLILSASLMSFVFQVDFLKDQKRYPRVREAILQKERVIEENVKKHDLTLDELHILISAYKAEEKLELYGKKKDEEAYKKIATYDICSSSGQLGPKRQQGDYQVPEGFYYIDRFNPASNFHLSLGLNYPNDSDSKKSPYDHLGGDIFIHGNCVTIGCLPMTDDKIKEIYLYAVHARNNGQLKIPVYIYPFRMTKDKFDRYKSRHPEFTAFWRNLKLGYDEFHRNRKELSVSVASNGDYIF